MFKAGFDEYIKGDWKEAKRIFEKVEEAKGFMDQPTRNLLSIMEETHFKAPSDWEGYRVLTEK